MCIKAKELFGKGISKTKRIMMHRKRMDNQY